MNKSLRPIIILLLLSLPTFSQLIRPGIHTMHDFHLFRLFEFDRCFREGVFPCRWAADATFGYGQPLFNFYGQFSYWLGESFHLFGFSLIDSTKLMFIATLIASALTMFLLSRSYWGNRGGIISALFYIYAPYRAIDVWVRGAMPEALSFVFFPLIFYFLDKILSAPTLSSVLGLSLSYSAIILTHNLSAMMIAPFIVLWIGLHYYRHRSPTFIKPLLFTFLLTGILSAFYILPLLVESRFVFLSKISQSLYDYRLHYTNLRQLFTSSFWGYGSSVWGPNDDLSFSVGYLHWLIPLVAGVYFFLQPRIRPPWQFIAFSALGLLAVFLTHGKSELIWKLIPQLSYVQFPWRFLSLSTLFLSLACGVIGNLKKVLIAPSLSLLLLLNSSFFRPDIWRSIADSEQFSGRLWAEQISSAKEDFWPSSAPQVPSSPPPAFPPFVSGEGFTLTSQKLSQSASYQIRVLSPTSVAQFPIVYFPGWRATLDGQPLPLSSSGSYGQITASIPQGNHHVRLQFSDTPVRQIGNFISFMTLITVALIYFTHRRHVLH